MCKEKIDILNETGHYLSVPSGVSMWPLLKSRENVVDIVLPREKPKKYDVILYHRPADDKCVLHRIVGERESYYIVYGDNCVGEERVLPEEIIGVASKFYRNGRWIDTDNKLYMLYVHLWCDLLPLRILFTRTRNKFLALKNKLR